MLVVNNRKIRQCEQSSFIYLLLINRSLAMNAWQLEHDVCERSYSRILELISERSKLKTVSRLYLGKTQELESEMKHFTQLLRDLHLANGRDQGLTQGEKERRQRMVDTLKTKERYLKDAFHNPEQNKVDSDKRNLLLGVDGGIADLGATGWNNAATTHEEMVKLHPEEEEGSKKQSSGQLKLSQEEILRTQDHGLDSLHDVILRQKRLAQTIGDEVELQNDLIDGVGDSMDQTRQRLLDTTRSVEVVGRRDSGTWKYWLVIVILLVIIIVIVVI